MPRTPHSKRQKLSPVSEHYLVNAGVKFPEKHPALRPGSVLVMAVLKQRTYAINTQHPEARRVRRLLRRQKQREDRKAQIEKRYLKALQRFAGKLVTYYSKSEETRGSKPQPPRNPLVESIYKQAFQKMFNNSSFSSLLPRRRWGTADLPWFEPNGFDFTWRMLREPSDKPTELVMVKPRKTGRMDFNFQGELLNLPADTWPERMPRRFIEERRGEFGQRQFLAEFQRVPYVPADTTIMPKELERFIAEGTKVVRFYKEPVVGYRFHLEEWIPGARARRALVEVVSFRKEGSPNLSIYLATVQFIKLDGFIEVG